MRTHTRPSPVFAAVLLLVRLSATFATDFPPAQNITWKSTNFKTVLTWGPEPTTEYSYTVEFSQLGRERQRNPHCIRSSRTQCDLSSSLTDLRACYTADVLSVPPEGQALELKEYPFSSSLRFCPYTQTLLLGPSFKLVVSPDQKMTTVHVSDPLTAAFKDGNQLSIRDVFGEELEYRVTYRRNKSTGKKVVTSKLNEVEVPGLDAGESYCFQVQALVRSRPTTSQLGELSQTQCTTSRTLPSWTSTRWV
ncbi:hypothetical protein WMY93_029873 [Mugilogobius chulae]|uniref:Tissue factor n=1 Tax=Mugilogobius chulae TaxID=88201 RepID=A0AAW0MX36_9GOBI